MKTAKSTTAQEAVNVFTQKIAAEAWTKKLTSCGFKVVEEPWEPYQPETKKEEKKKESFIQFLINGKSV